MVAGGLLRADAAEATGAGSGGATGETEGRPCQARMAATAAMRTAKTANAFTPGRPMSQRSACSALWLDMGPRLGGAGSAGNSPQRSLWITSPPVDNRAGAVEIDYGRR